MPKQNIKSNWEMVWKLHRKRKQTETKNKEIGKKVKENLQYSETIKAVLGYWDRI